MHIALVTLQHAQAQAVLYVWLDGSVEWFVYWSRCGVIMAIILNVHDYGVDVSEHQIVEVALIAFDAVSGILLL